MERTVGYLVSEERMALYTWKEGENGSTAQQLLDWDGATEEMPIEAILGQAELLEKFQEQNAQLSRFFPGHVHSEDLSALEASELGPLSDKIRRQWGTQNSLETQIKLFSHLGHLRPLWLQDRTAFFEEFWFLCRKILAPKELIIIFKSVRKAQKENEKDSLVPMKIMGPLRPTPAQGGMAEDEILENFRPHFPEGGGLGIAHQENGEMTFCAQVDESSFIIMGRGVQWGPLSFAILSSLIDGLKRDPFIRPQVQ